VTGAQSVLRSGLGSPSGIALDPQGDFVVIERDSRTVLRIDSSTGATLQTISVGDKLSGGASYSIAVAPNGVIYATDFSTYNGGTFVNSPGSVIRIDPVTGVQTHVTVGGNLTDPYDIEIDGNGDLIVGDYNGNSTGRIVRVSTNTGSPNINFLGG
jgi:sugar lactone lactonase YvrE